MEGGGRGGQAATNSPNLSPKILVYERGKKAPCTATTTTIRQHIFYKEIEVKHTHTHTHTHKQKTKKLPGMTSL